MDGQFLTAEIPYEYNPNTIVHLSGRLLITYVYYEGVGGYHIKFVNTDTERKEFSTSILSLPVAGHTLIDATLCELVGGNIGIIFQTTYSGNYYLYYMIVTATGSVVTAGTQIASWATSIWASKPFVIRKADNNYLLVYAKQASTHYHIYGRASFNFTSWGAETELSSSTPQFGLTDTKPKDHPSLVQIIGGNILLFFDYRNEVGSNGEELRNIYFSISADNGSTWGAAAEITGYTDYSSIGKHPLAVQKEDGTLHMVYTEDSSVRSKDKDDFCNSGNDGSTVVNMHFDAVRRKIYAWINANTTNTFGRVVEIDIDTWIVTKCWSTTTTPGFPTWLYTINPKPTRVECKGDGHYALAGAHTNASSYGTGVFVVNAVDNTITYYCFRSSNSASVINIKNVNIDLSGYGTPYTWELHFCKVDAATSRLYCVFGHFNIGNRGVTVGYVDLLEPLPPDGLYTWTEVVPAWTDPYTGIYGGVMYDMLILPEIDYIVLPIPSSLSSGGWEGAVLIFKISDGSLVKYIRKADAAYDNFPLKGMYRVVYLNDKLYGSVRYYLASEPTKKGLCEIDFTSWNITYQVPTWGGAITEYNLREGAIDEFGKIIFGTYYYGITIYNPSDYSWSEPFDSTTIPGMFPAGETDSCPWVAYDPVKNLIIFNTVGTYSDTIRIMSYFGMLKQSKYYTGLYSGGVWGWTFQDEFVQGYLDYDSAIAVEPVTKNLYAFWIHEDEEIMYLKWDYEGGEKDLTDFILRSEETTLKKTVTGEPAELSFSVKYGYLFDNFNVTSLLSMFLKKGRKLQFQIGEVISGTTHWVEQGILYVVEKKMTYERPKYPSMHVTAKDGRVFWEENEVVATDNYAAIPEEVVSGLLQDHAGLLVGDIDISAWDNSALIFVQWIDMNLSEILKKIEDRFGWAIVIGVDNKVHAVKRTMNKSVNHTYTGTNWLIELTPDDTFSDFTNKVIVIGQERDKIRVTFAEERILGDTIIHDWNDGEKTYRIYYSNDKSRTCNIPRLKEIDYQKSLAFTAHAKISNYIVGYGDATIELSAMDTVNHKWCELTVSTPDLSPALHEKIVALIGSFFLPDWVVTAGFLVEGGYTIRFGTWTSALALFWITNILSAVASFRFEIWARPIGHVFRTVQNTDSTGEDLELQVELGRVVTKTVEEPLCYSVAQCNEVADHIMEIIKLQRKRINFSKVTHLQDEAGDILQIPHPYSGQPLNMMIVELTRRIKIPDEEGSEGYVKDDITAWVG